MRPGMLPMLHYPRRSRVAPHLEDRIFQCSKLSYHHVSTLDSDLEINLMKEQNDTTSPTESKHRGAKLDLTLCNAGTNCRENGSGQGSYQRPPQSYPHSASNFSKVFCQ